MPSCKHSDFLVNSNIPCHLCRKEKKQKKLEKKTTKPAAGKSAPKT
jgi:hypothetical protein